ncbi:MAG: hypothetical protein C4576_24590 [Desulfobacteraceae bacterium]|nr:MAG: hypothetical protein C4576_24590 [Desulfobacteraceae bacterium]
MAWQSLGSEAEIKRIFDSVIQTGTSIEVHIAGEDQTFFSKFVQVVPSPGKDLKEAEAGLHLALKNLSPDFGNQRIRKFPAVEIFFPFRQFLCRFRSDVLRADQNPQSEIVIGYPPLLEVEEKRKEERFYPDSPDFLSAVLKHTDKRKQETRTYDLPVLNFSRHGVGLLVGKDALSLLDELRQGDFIPEILLFGEVLVIQLSAVVRHKSVITEGLHAGLHMVGLESEAGLVEHFDELRSQRE